MLGSLACCLLLFWLLPPDLQLSSCSVVRSLAGAFSYLSGLLVAGPLTIAACAALSALRLGVFSDL